MTVKNLAISGFTGGAGHVGLATQGYGGVYTAPAIPTQVGVYAETRKVNLTFLRMLRELIEILTS